MILVLCLVFLLFPQIVIAGVQSNYTVDIVKTFSILIIIIAILFIALYLLKKLKLPYKLRGGKIKLIDKLYIDSKHYIAIIEVEEKKLLIGVGDNVNLIVQMDKVDEKQ